MINQSTKILEEIWKKRASRYGRRIYWEWMPKTRWYLIPTIIVDATFKEVGIHFLCLSVFMKWKKIIG